MKLNESTNIREKSTKKSGATAAFTLTELLFSIAIIAVLMSILLPVISSVREKSQRVGCVSNIRGLLTATLQAASFNNGEFPELHESSYNNPYWFDADNLDSFSSTHGLAEDNFYYPSSENWTAEQFWDYQPGARVAGYLYMANDTDWTVSATVSGEAVADDLPLFAKRVVDESAYQHLWIDLTRKMSDEWGTGVNHPDASGSPAGAHAGFRDGHVEWVPWDELSSRYMQVGGIQIWF